MRADARSVDMAVCYTRHEACAKFVEKSVTTKESSPCINVCKLDEDGEYCTACGQTIQQLMR